MTNHTSTITNDEFINRGGTTPHRPVGNGETQRRRNTAIGFAGGIAATLLAGIAFATATTSAAPADGESTFVPMTPCRLFDTRPDTNIGPRDRALGGDETMTQQVTGVNGDCDVPADATAIAINATAVDATAPSFATFFPSDAPRPNSSNLNYVPGQAPTPNKIDVKLSPTGEMSIYNAFGEVHMLADVTGYYTNQAYNLTDSRVEALLSIIPKATSDVGDGVANIGEDEVVVASVTIESNTGGRVILNSATSVTASVDEAGVRCAISDDGTLGDDNDHYQSWRGGTGALDAAQLAGTRAFDVGIGTHEFSLVCRSLFTIGANVANANLTALHIGTP